MHWTRKCFSKVQFSNLIDLWIGKKPVKICDPGPVYTCSRMEWMHIVEVVLHGSVIDFTVKIWELQIAGTLCHCIQIEKCVQFHSNIYYCHNIDYLKGIHHRNNLEKMFLLWFSPAYSTRSYVCSCTYHTSTETWIFLLPVHTTSMETELSVPSCTYHTTPHYTLGMKAS